VKQGPEAVRNYFRELAAQECRNGAALVTAYDTSTIEGFGQQSKVVWICNPIAQH
jgi:hypothetical protein